MFGICKFHLLQLLQSTTYALPMYSNTILAYRITLNPPTMLFFYQSARYDSEAERLSCHTLMARTLKSYEPQSHEKTRLRK